MLLQRPPALRLPALALAALVALAGPAHAQLAAGQAKFLGATGRGTDTVKPDPAFDAYWNQVTPENAGKWKYPEREQDQMNWEVLDYWYAYARDRGFAFKQHTFVWGMQEPDWIGALPPAEQRAEAEEWIRLYFQRYPETDLVDVLNEPITIPATYREALGGAGETGWDWVIWTFETAKRYRDQYAPGARLLLNEHSVLKDTGKMNRYLEIVDLLVDRGLLDGVGVQGHFLETTSVSRVRANLDAVASRGLPVYVSEFDLNLGDDGAQLAKYQELFPVLWEHPAVAGVTLWGYKENEIWRSRAYLVRADGSERPALTWLREYLRAEPPAEPPAAEQRPFGGTPAALPGVVEVEAFDEGGEGVAYHDADAARRGDACCGGAGARPGEGVDLFSTDGGTGVGWVEPGEWLEYTVEVARSGDYDVALRVATPRAGRSFRLLVDGDDVTGAVAVPVTGGWSRWGEARAAGVRLTAGRHVLRLALDAGPFNLDRLTVEAAGTAVVVRARGRTGSERMELRVGGDAVQAWTVGTDDAEYAYQAAGAVAASDVSVAFVNDDKVADGTGRDLHVDRVTVGGAVYESEAPTTFSTGTWARGSGCAGGYKASEWLHCNGAFSYARRPAGVAALAVDAPAAEAAPLAAYPNPSAGRSTVAFSLAGASGVRVEAFDALGRRVAVLAEGPHEAGRHRVPFDTSALPVGVYFVRFEAGGVVETERVTVVR